MALRNAGCAPSSNGCALSSSTEIYLANSGPVEDGLSQEMLSGENSLEYLAILFCTLSFLSLSHRCGLPP
ncbi:hypothetical protein PC116_g2822 [Phytophthora cactorum]|nr:hypothetical protein Pcac1_g14880 [Phytophthora cactorum]KAG3090535.1 hypothetical protein PI125_g17662 [Phytophthora idaei]KAG2922005.1 hypothetical protein PC114_g5437 [Phytophthora cactorum]KAG3017452.1 hypothetical protein PC120_g10996 [Phytophthora cactorum]KAG3027658.1 hypothetical protein PC119_g7252 [Phytophthora cactorum]